MQSKGGVDRGGMAAAVRQVANAPGEVILPGDLAKALEILAAGGEVNYEGATGVEFDEAGDPPGSYLVMEVEDGKFVQKAVIK